MRIQNGEAQPEMSAEEVNPDALLDADAVALLEDDDVDEEALSAVPGDEKPEAVDSDDEISDTDLKAAEEHEQEEEAEKAEKDDKADKFTPEMQAAFDKRVGKEVRKTKELQERLAAVESDLQAARASSAEVESLREQANSRVPLHSSYLTKDDQQLFKNAHSIEQEKTWLMEHIDGYDDDTHPDKSMSASAVRSRLSKVDLRLGTVQQANDRYAVLQRKMASDIETWNKLVSGYDTSDSLMADLNLAKAIRAKRSKVKENLSDKKPVPNTPTESTKAAVARAAEPGSSETSRGFNGRKFMHSDMTTESLVESGLG